VLGCFRGTAAAAVLAELGLETLEVRRRRARLRWYGQLRAMPAARLPAAVLAASGGSAPRATGTWLGRVRSDWNKLRQRARARGDADTDVELEHFFSARADSFRSAVDAALRRDAAGVRQRELRERATVHGVVTASRPRVWDCGPVIRRAIPGGGHVLKDVL